MLGCSSPLRMQVESEGLPDILYTKCDIPVGDCLCVHSVYPFFWWSFIPLKHATREDRSILWRSCPQHTEIQLGAG